jgi:type I site-specific restriction-modification system R (restriction) subunit
MDEPRQKPKDKPSVAEQTASPPAPLQPAGDNIAASAAGRPLRHFEDAFYEYLREIQECNRGVLEAYQRAYQNYARSIKEILDGGRQRLEEASQNYLRELQGAQESGTVQSEAPNAYHRLIKAQQTALGPDDCQKLTDALKTYQQAIAEASQPGATRKCAQDAFRHYLDALRQAWAEVDPESLDAYSLVAISNSILAVTARALSC